MTGASDVDPFADEAVPETAEVRPGEQLDWNAIERHLRDHLPAELDVSGAFEVQQFPNGAANLTYLIAFGDTELVLRRPPFGTLAPGAHAEDAFSPRPPRATPGGNRVGAAANLSPERVIPSRHGDAKFG